MARVVQLAARAQRVGVDERCDSAASAAGSSASTTDRGVRGPLSTLVRGCACRRPPTSTALRRQRLLRLGRRVELGLVGAVDHRRVADDVARRLRRRRQRLPARRRRRRWCAARRRPAPRARARCADPRRTAWRAIALLLLLGQHAREHFVRRRRQPRRLARPASASRRGRSDTGSTESTTPRTRAARSASRTRWRRARRCPLSGVSSCVPIACSGDMYSGVPTIAFSCVSVAESMSLETPKSSTLTKSSRPPRRERKMLAGLRSRCTTPAVCATSSASAISAMMRSAATTPHAPALQAIGEVLALEQLHDEVGRARLGDLVVEHLDDVRVRQRRGDLRLAAERWPAS